MIGDNWSLEFVQNMEFAIFGLLIADLLGIYWYLKMKKLGLALMIVCIVFFALALYLERRKKDEMLEEEPEKKEKPEKKEEKPKKDKEPEEKPDDFLGFNLDPDEYQKRVEKGIDEALF